MEITSGHILITIIGLLTFCGLGSIIMSILTENQEDRPVYISKPIDNISADILEDNYDEWKPRNNISERYGYSNTNFN